MNWYPLAAIAFTAVVIIVALLAQRWLQLKAQELSPRVGSINQLLNFSRYTVASGGQGKLDNFADNVLDQNFTSCPIMPIGEAPTHLS